MFVSTAFAMPLNLSGQNNQIQKYVNHMKSDTLFRDAVVGIMVMNGSGKTVASWNPDAPLLTASTMKTITTGLSLKLLGPDYRFSTKICHSGYVSNGVLYGDLFIVGGGDPTLGSKDTVAIPVATVFEEWAKALSEAGIARINGSIVADDRYFQDETIPESWSWSNLGPSFGSGASGLSFCENVQYFKFIPGKNVGDKVFMESVYPQVPGMEYKIGLTSAETSTGDKSSYFVSNLAKIGEFNGTLPANKDSVMIDVSNKFGPLSCAFEFRKFLEKKGILSDPQVKDAKEYDAPGLSEMKPITETFSPKLASIVNVTNRISNNFYAETLYKTIGKKMTGVGSYDSSRVAVARLMSEMGLSQTGYTQVDGSGLSRQNYVSARFLCKYFSAIRNSSDFEYFFNSLPQPGGPGTLKNVLGKIETEKKSKIHAKSGSLSNVRCYAGYVVRPNGELYSFAVLINNYSAKASQMQVGVENFMQALVK